MSNSNFKGRRFFIILTNSLIFFVAAFLITMIGYYTIATLTGQNLLLTQKDVEFQNAIKYLIDNGIFFIMALIFYLGAMQLVYSFLIIKWTIYLSDEQYLKHRFLVLIYSFFNLSFWTAFLLLSLDHGKMNTEIQVKRKMAFHETLLFSFTGIFSIIISLLLQTSTLNNPNIQSNFISTISVGAITLGIGLLGAIFIGLYTRNEKKLHQQSDFYASKFINILAKIFIAFNVIFVITKMVLILVINTLGYINQMFGNNRQGFFSRIGATINLILMYTIVFQVFKALTTKNDEPLVIDLTNVQTAAQTRATIF